MQPLQLCVNYSIQAVELVRSGVIEIDRFKCPDWDDVIAIAAQTSLPYVHFPLELGRGQLVTVDLDRVERLMRQTRTPSVNVHLSARVKDLPAGIDRDGFVDWIGDELRILTSRFGAATVIVENIIARVERKPISQLSVDASIISDIVHENGTGFLFDISHAALTCEALGWDYDRYVAELPLDRLREVHITGIQPVGSHLGDHMAMDDASWQRVQHAMSAIRSGEWPAPTFVSLEYGGLGEKFTWRSAASELSSTVPRLLQMVRAAQPREAAAL